MSSVGYRKCQLPLWGAWKLVGWLIERDQHRWDQQMDADAAISKLDFLFQEAEDEAAQGTLREWPK